MENFIEITGQFTKYKLDSSKYVITTFENVTQSVTQVLKQIITKQEREGMVFVV